MTPYDLIPYPSKPFAQTHPDRLATHARLLGLNPPPVSTARVLEIGGGDGVNAINIAVTLPSASIVCFDLSTAAVARGQAIVRDLGLANIELKVADIMAPELEGTFDYICAHGVYSWVPDAVREEIMALIGRLLSPDGVAFVSYNTLPGCRSRQMMRDLLRFRLRAVTDLHERVQAIRPTLQAFIDRCPEDPFHLTMKIAAESMLERQLEVVCHDEMGEIYHPVHLFEFCEHAGRHGLQFLSEAESGRAGEALDLPNEVVDPDYLNRAQNLDFDIARTFRQSLLVHEHIHIDRRPIGANLQSLYVSSFVVRKADGHFQVRETDFVVEDERMTDLVVTLGEIWPESLPISDLGLDDQRLQVLLRMYLHGLVELRSTPAPCARDGGERPKANPLGRWQAQHGAPHLATLRHEVLAATDDGARLFISKLDGRTSRTELAQAMLAQQGGDPQAVRNQVDSALEGLGRMGMLLAASP